MLQTEEQWGCLLRSLKSMNGGVILSKFPGGCCMFDGDPGI